MADESTKQAAPERSEAAAPEGGARPSGPRSSGPRQGGGRPGGSGRDGSRKFFRRKKVCKCTPHQRRVTEAIMQARNIALLPFAAGR